MVWILALLLLFSASVYVWAVVLVDGGFVTSVPAMPWEFRLAARVAGVDRGDRSSATIWGAVLCLAIVNLPVLLALVPPHDPVSFAASVMYVAVHLGWLARIRRAVQRIRPEP